MTTRRDKCWLKSVVSLTLLISVILLALVLTTVLAGCSKEVAPQDTQGSKGGGDPISTLPAPAPSGPSPAPSTPSGDRHFRRLYSVDGLTLWALRDVPFGIAKSTDGGKTWKNTSIPGLDGAGNSGKAGLPSAADAFLSGFFSDRNTGFVVLKSSSQKNPGLVIWRTSDGGATWKDSKIEWTDSRRSAATSCYLTFPRSECGWLLVSHGIATGSNWVDAYVSKDGGESWVLAAATDPEKSGPDSLPLGGLKTGISALDEKRAWVTGFDYGDKIWLQKTEDGGKTWRRETIEAPKGYSTEAGSVETRPPIFFNKDHGYLPVVFHQEGQPTIFYMTDDGGKTWRAKSPVKSGKNQALTWAFADEKVGCATDGIQFFLTEDGCRTWKTTTPKEWSKEAAERPINDLRAVKVGPEKYAFWVISGGEIFKSQDGGTTWEAVAP